MQRERMMELGIENGELGNGLEPEVLTARKLLGGRRPVKMRGPRINRGIREIRGKGPAERYFCHLRNFTWYVRLVPVLKNEEGGTGQSGRCFSLRHLLVIAQLAISVVVLVSAGPIVKRMYKVQVADPGFQTANLLSVRLDPGLAGYDAGRARLFFTDLVRQVEALPGVRTASLAHNLPFAG